MNDTKSSRDQRQLSCPRLWALLWLSLRSSYLRCTMTFPRVVAGWYPHLGLVQDKDLCSQTLLVTAGTQKQNTISLLVQPVKGGTAIVAFSQRPRESPLPMTFLKWTNRAVRETAAPSSTETRSIAFCYLWGGSLNASVCTTHTYCACLLLHICYLLYISKQERLKASIQFFIKRVVFSFCWTKGQNDLNGCIFVCFTQLWLNY